MTAPDTKPYSPANGTEGRAFEARWCAHCVHDKAYRETFDADCGPEDGCPILASGVFGAQAPEWTYRDGVPWCSAFTEDKANPARCLFTKEMF